MPREVARREDLRVVVGREWFKPDVIAVLIEVPPVPRVEALVRIMAMNQAIAPGRAATGAASE